MLEAVDGGPAPKIKRASGVPFDVGDDVYFGSKSDARSDWSNNPALNSASKYFFRKATGKSTGFAARNLGNGRILLQYESPATYVPGQAKVYVGVVDLVKGTLSEFRYTRLPNGGVKEIRPYRVTSWHYP